MAEYKFVNGYAASNDEFINFVDSNAQRKLEILRKAVKEITKKVAEIGSTEELTELAEHIKKATAELDQYKSDLELIKEKFKDVDDKSEDFGSDLAMLASLPKQNKANIDSATKSINNLISRVDILEEQLEAIDIPSLESRVNALEELGLTKAKVDELEHLIAASGLEVIDKPGGEKEYRLNIQKVDGLDANLTDYKD